MSSNQFKTSAVLRLLVVGFLVIILLIPALMVQNLIVERQARRDEAFMEVSQKWGYSQVVSGPILSIPYKVYVKDKEGQIATQINYVHLLPQSLDISGEVFPEVRYRGIYEVVLYNAKLKIAGGFLPAEVFKLNLNNENLLWTDSFISLGISDMKGIKKLISFKIGGEEIETNPGIRSKDILNSGISINLPIEEADKLVPFETEIDVNGSGDLFFTPLGIETKVHLESGWVNPSFTGEFLPEKRMIDENGFSANWHILHLNRNYPQQWEGNQHKIDYSAFGVRLLIPVDEYQKTMRTAKYAIMFISLTFLAFFMIELLNKKIIHPIQYLLIGLALIIFYTLLLSLSEHLVFNSAYVLSSLAIILLLSAYTRSVLKNNLHTIIIAGLLVVLYGYLFIVLQLQDYALLMGSISLFVILSLVMYLTRKIDWYSIWKNEPESS